MQKALTAKTLDALKPAAKRYEVHDLYCSGLTVRVSVGGQKVFNVKFRYGLKQKRQKLGVYPSSTSRLFALLATWPQLALQESVPHTFTRAAHDGRVDVIERRERIES